MTFSIRYSGFFRLPRKVFKMILVLLYPVVIRIWKLPKVLSITDTIQSLLNDRLSIARFGDGELLYIIDKLNLPFQNYDSRLANELKEILISRNPRLLVGLPSGYHGMKTLTRDGRLFWKAQIAWVYPRIQSLLLMDRVYANASMTRPYQEVVDKSLSEYHFNLIKKLWQDKDVLIVEGVKTRFGIGNDLLSNSFSIKRILAPEHHAFRVIRELEQAVLHHGANRLVLIALGPTAKVLAYRLSLAGFQAIDIGNLDIEYEWFLRGETKKVKIPGKYTSEAVGGRVVEDIKDELYNSQVIAKII